MFSAVTNQFKSNATKAAEKTAANAAKATANAAANGALSLKDKFKKLMATKGPIIIFILAVILVFVIVIIYITFALKTSSLSGKVLTKQPIKLDQVSVPVIIDSALIPKPSVGREFAYAFWLYVEQFEQTPSNNKLIFYRGAAGDISGASTIVMMDSTENKMYIAIKTQDNTLPNLVPSDGSSTAADLRKIIWKNYFKNPTATGADINKYVIIEVDYVPLQRWVNFTVIVDNKIITLFMDGEIYSVKGTDELKALRKPEIDSTGHPLHYSLIIDKPDGNIFVGQNTINNKTTVNGYLTGLTAFNYAPSINEVKSSYNSGPLTGGGFLSKLGIPYSFRSPIYKMQATDTDSSQQ